jgi:magnesium-transporting ATPase (P-type)
VVGDVIQLQIGDKVPSDCIIIQSHNLKVDERLSSVNNGTCSVAKNVNDDPFLFVNSFVESGQCSAMVACVGEHTTRPK